MDNTSLSWITGYIWGIADDVLRDLYVRGKQVSTHLFGQEINSETVFRRAYDQAGAP